MVDITRRELLKFSAIVPLFPLVPFIPKDEEGEIAYKVVTKNLESHSYWMMDGGPIEYEINKWVSPNLGKGKLFVFSSLNDARFFVSGYYGYYNYGKAKIFKCLCLDITDNIYDDGYPDERQDPGWPWPNGTRFASKVKLIEEISYEA